MYKVIVPAGVVPGETFQASVNGTVMNVICPQGVAAGSEVQIPGPQSPSAAPLPAGLPSAVYAGTPQGYAGGQHTGGQYGGGPYPGTGHHQGGQYPGAQAQHSQHVYGYSGQGPVYSSNVAMVEETVVSPLGWVICIIGTHNTPLATVRARPLLRSRKTEAPLIPSSVDPPHIRHASAASRLLHLSAVQLARAALARTALGTGASDARLSARGARYRCASQARFAAAPLGAMSRLCKRRFHDEARHVPACAVPGDALLKRARPNFDRGSVLHG
jgi:hypothetical protein